MGLSSDARRASRLSRLSCLFQEDVGWRIFHLTESILLSCHVDSTGVHVQFHELTTILKCQ